LRCVELPPTSRRALTRATALAAIVFVLLTVALARHPEPTGIESAVDRAFLASRGSRIFGTFKAVTVTGSVLVVAIGAAVLAVECWIRLRDLRLAVACVVATALAGVAETVVKPIVGRPRPATRVFTGQTGAGFPSGHTTGATALAICAVAVAWSLAGSRRSRVTVGVAATAYVVVIGVSRLVVGAHYSLDVVGGWLLGSTIAIAVLMTVTRSGTIQERVRRSPWP